jgi:GH35 family endo-1,4-beta-xylanase
MQQFAATGLKIHISELDISINPKNDFAITYTEAAK